MRPGVDPGHVLVRALGSLVSGILLALSFPPYGWWLLAPVAITGLTLSVAGRRLRVAFGLGSLAGIAFFGVLVSWMRVVGMDAWLGVTIFSAILIGLTAAAMAAVMRRPWWPVSIALVWVCQEAIRDRVPLGGWPWGRLAFSQADAPWLPTAAYGGTVALTFLVALTGGLMAWALLRAADRTAAAVVAVAAVALLPVMLGLLPTATSGQDLNGPASARIAVIQGDVPTIGLGFADGSERRAVLDNHVRETVSLAQAVQRGIEPRPDAVLWPENSSDIDPYGQPDARAAIDKAAHAIGVPLLVGAVIVNPDDLRTVLNVGVVWNPVTGPGDRYVKQHPVPFGEYVPFRSVLAPLSGRFDLVPRDFAPGARNGVLQVGPVLLGDVICFEVAYDDLVRKTVAAGARMLVVQTNNATYTGSGQTEQQLAMARIRAVEHERTVAIAATNGISAVFTPDGAYEGQLPEQTAGWINADVALRDSFSVSDRLGAWPEMLFALLGLAVTIWGVLAAPSVSCGRSRICNWFQVRLIRKIPVTVNVR